MNKFIFTTFVASAVLFVGQGAFAMEKFIDLIKNKTYKLEEEPLQLIINSPKLEEIKYDIWEKSLNVNQKNEIIINIQKKAPSSEITTWFCEMLKNQPEIKILESKIIEEEEEISINITITIPFKESLAWIENSYLILHSGTIEINTNLSGGSFSSGNTIKEDLVLFLKKLNEFGTFEKIILDNYTGNVCALLPEHEDELFKVVESPMFKFKNLEYLKRTANYPRHAVGKIVKTLK